MLTENEREFLLHIARLSMIAAVNKKGALIPDKVPPALQENRGAFVTLYKSGELRGCIGYIEGFKPLVEIVWDAAEKAALEDYRFIPVTPNELTDIDIQISVLSPPELITDINKIEVDKHGLIIEFEHNRGLLLPQVATEYGWDRETFLNQTARKAGLTSDRWKDPKSKIYIFSAEIFKENK